MCEAHSAPAGGGFFVCRTPVVGWWDVRQVRSVRDVPLPPSSAGGSRPRSGSQGGRFAPPFPCGDSPPSGPLPGSHRGAAVAAVGAPTAAAGRFRGAVRERPDDGGRPSGGRPHVVLLLVGVEGDESPSGCRSRPASSRTRAHAAQRSVSRPTSSVPRRCRGRRPGHRLRCRSPELIQRIGVTPT